MATVGVTSFSQLKEKAEAYLPAEKVTVVEEAYRFAVEAHQGQMRLSGDPYVEHPVQTAIILAGLQFDATSLAAALLHDVPENCDIPVEKIQEKFGPEVSRLVDGVTKLGKVSWQTGGTAPRETQAENLRKMLVAMAEDLRVVFIKLADRLHNMRTLEALTPEKQHSIAQETLEIYTPLAHRLGIWELKWQLEDLAFQYLEPEKFRRIVNLLAARRTQRENFITQVIDILKKELGEVGLKAELSGRPKHIYSINQKMQRGRDFNDIYDLLALRVLVSTLPDCYSVVGIIHSLWRPIPEEFDDYIANPKPNGYQSLHTAVMCFGTTPLEVQIRTREMNYNDEYGMAAHWRYKQGQKADLHFEEKVGWLRQLIEWHRELSGSEEFLESVKTDIFIDQVFVYTPKGDIKDLPRGSTPLDFAYRVHTELGHRCIGAKVNGRLMPLDYELKNGDVVDIMSTKGAKGPSLDWLNPHVGFVHTSHAKEKIRQWFKRQERTENIERGRQILEKELRHLGITIEREKLAELCNFSNAEDFLAAIGYGGISTHQIAIKLAAQQETPKAIPEVAPRKPVPSTVHVLGVGNLVTHLAQCCHPVPGDKIIGYITRSRGVTIHREDCYNVLHEDEEDRLVPVEWGQADSLYPVNVKVEAWDRVGLVRDITIVVAEEKVNIASMATHNHDDHTVTMNLTMETQGLAQLSRLLKKIESVKGVMRIVRMGDQTSAQKGDKT
ncbi:MAG: bifunctional (p)ppGpp synthetase/guanosine-3',5'-bis(diphosphate) 3'-pyrophosphohydrolase [Dehalococcoidia bacterium]|nr:MAG: bifunctional (p)ppGpp synthetase/guanosine-3',5'-bis(diphosphate) 3'-pyrophosphohydrolase [Dehalococcoidia bacterium]